jgi:hypothetical protein
MSVFFPEYRIFPLEKPELPFFSGKDEHNYFFIKNIIFESFIPSFVEIN